MNHRAFRHTLPSCVAAIGLFAVTSSTPAFANNQHGGQLCTLGSSGVGQQGTVICTDVTTGATTQSVPVGDTVSGPGGIAGSLTHRGRRVLVTNQTQCALLFELTGGS